MSTPDLDRLAEPNDADLLQGLVDAYRREVDVTLPSATAGGELISAAKVNAAFDLAHVVASRPDLIAAARELAAVRAELSGLRGKFDALVAGRRELVGALRTANHERDQLRAELAATRRAKQENDERFQLAAAEAREQHITIDRADLEGSDGLSVESIGQLYAVAARDQAWRALATPPAEPTPEPAPTVRVRGMAPDLTTGELREVEFDAPKHLVWPNGLPPMSLALSTDEPAPSDPAPASASTDGDQDGGR